MIITKKLTDSTLKRITKSDNTYEDVHITDIESNVISEGTSITDSVLENINYKDDNSVSFNVTNSIPTVSNNNCAIYSMNGKLYCKISGYNPFEINQTTADYLLKRGTNYTNNGSMEYFNLNSSMKLFSTSTKIGAIPQRNVETTDLYDASFFDISTTEIKALIENEQKFKLTSDRFILNGKNTVVEIDSTKTKFNCNTNLSKASYGNNKYRLEFDNDLTIKNQNNNADLLKIDSNGNIIIKGDTLENYIKSIARKEIRRYKEMKLISSVSTVNLDGYYVGNTNYVIYFSDTDSSDRVMSMEINGLDIPSMSQNPIYYERTNSYYYLDQYEATEEGDSDSLSIMKIVNGIPTIVYFREVYEEII